VEQAVYSITNADATAKQDEHEFFKLEGRG
jgi:hypothetical protein